MKKIISLIILIIPVTLVARHTLTGVVVEEGDKGVLSPLIGVNVYWLGTTTGGTTDANGVFEIECLHESNDLVISYVGYRADTVQIKTHDEVTILLKNAQSLEGVEITYRKKSTEISFIETIKTEVISEQELFKAACCNLSESFETNPSIDVSFTDAVTGTRQIRMLGLSGKYTQVTREAMPDVRGLASNFGLTFIPGSWISSIQVIKGPGSVVQGFESLTGQINTELKKPRDKEKFFLNAYINQEGRNELNINFTNEVNHRWASATLLHAHSKPFKVDGNDDGFLDFPKSGHGNVLHRWKFTNHRGINSQFGFRYLYDKQIAGQKDFDTDLPRDTSNGYRVSRNTSKLDIWGKIGYVFPEKRYKTIGLQLFGSWHDQDSYFGLTDYDATHYTGYANLIYQSIFGSTRNKFSTGISYQFDNFSEKLESATFDRTEYVPGAFFEYTFTHLDKVTIVAGIRGDYNNLFGFFATPRLHTRFLLAEGTVLRLSAGRGQRTANVIAENMGLLASSRQITIVESNSKDAFGLDPEVAWNYGINLTHCFRLAQREGTISLDFYRTDFVDQVVVDVDHDPQEVMFYNLKGKSYANSVQAQVDYEIVQRFDVRVAYRWYNVETDYTSGRLQKPLIAQHRAFINLAYATNNGWKFDYTVQWQGEKRIPSTLSNPEVYQLEQKSRNYYLMNAQITKVFKKGVEIYVGMENIANYKQDDPILAADDPFGPNFDSSLIWGPIFGRNTYAGLRYRILDKE